MFSLINCPKCKSDLVAAPQSVSCPSCKSTFPLFNGIPWIFRSPEIVMLQWQARISGLHAMLDQYLNRLNHELRQIGLLPETKTRLEKLIQAVNENSTTIKQMLDPLMNYKGNAFGNMVPKIDEKVSAEQTVESYVGNIFRDWCWNTQENESSLLAIEKVLPKSLNSEKVVFLGCGAGRFTADLHKKLKPKLSIAVDINPLLLFTFKNLIEKKPFSLWEIPVVPLSLDNVCVKHNFTAEVNDLKGLELLFADGCNFPIKPKSADCVVTAWFVDVVKQDFRDLAKRINTALKKGGVWINLGPLGFQRRNIIENYSIDEIKSAILESGFALNKIIEEDLPYLQSPYSGQKRFEHIYSFATEKISEAKEPAFFSTLPKWLLDTHEGIPRSQSVLRELPYHQVAFQVLGAIDGKNSVDDIVKLFSQAYKIPMDQAHQVVVGFLTEKFEL